MNVSEVAEMFGVKGTTVEAWARTGELPGTKDKSGAWTFDRIKVEAYLKSKYVPAKQGSQEIVKDKLRRM